MISSAEANRLDNARPRVHGPRAGWGWPRSCRTSRSGSRNRGLAWVDESYLYLMLFTGDPLPDVGGRSLAVDPMTCPPNAFRTGGRSDQAGATRLVYTLGVFEHPSMPSKGPRSGDP
jgi:hypothetical protein